MSVTRLAVVGLLVLSFSCQRREQTASSDSVSVERTERSSAGGDRAANAQDSIAVDESVRQRWFKNRSYYAFMEIIDGLDPNFRHSAPTMKDVEQALGPPTCAGLDCYPNFTKRDWLYDTDRKIPAGSKAILSFDEHEVLKSIDWVSE